METAGLWMLLAVAIVLLPTGLPAFAVLMGVSGVFADADAVRDWLDHVLDGASVK